MKSKILRLLVTILVISAFSFTLHAQNRVYTRGHVWAVTMIKTMPGMTDDYIASLKSTIKSMNDEGIKQGLMVSYKILMGDNASPGDWDILIMAEYPDANAVNGNQDKWDAIQQKMVGDASALKQIMSTRTSMREIYGVKTLSEVVYNK